LTSHSGEPHRKWNRSVNSFVRVMNCASRFLPAKKNISCLMNPKKLSLLIAAMAFAIWAQPLTALDPNRAVSQYIHESWRTENGLFCETINCIAQTADGYLWLGTEDGLIRFDGQRFVQFNSKNTPEISDNQINAVAVDSRDSLWIGMGKFGGLACYQNGKFSHFGRQQGLPCENVMALYPEKDVLWVGTWGEGLFRWQGDKVTAHYTAKQGMASNVVYAICRDRSGSLWIGHWGNGLSRLQKGSFTTYAARDGLQNAVVWSLYEDRRGNLWALTQDGLYQHSNGRFRRFSTRDGLTNNRVRSVCEDRDGNLWFGSWAGLDRYRDGRFTPFKLSDGLTNDIVRSLFEDREGNLWIGTWSGLNRLRDGKFVTFTTREGLAADMVLSLASGLHGEIWVGTDGGGLNRIRGDRIEHYPLKFGNHNDMVYTLCQGRNGDLWIGSPAGLIRWREGRVQECLTDPYGNPGNFVRMIFQERSGDLWVATEKTGLFHLDENGRNNRPRPAAFKKLAVNSILQDRQGQVWLGSDDGLYLFLDDGLRRFSKREGLVHNTIRTLSQDSEDSIWIGTDDGLTVLKGEQFYSFHVHSGLCSTTIFTIFEDRIRDLWFSSPAGIFRIRRSDLDAYTSGRMRTFPCALYGTLDGMRSSDCNGMLQPAGCRTADGKMWFATIKGVVRLDPEHLHWNGVPPPLRIDRITVDRREIDARYASRIGPARSLIEFDFSAASLSVPSRVKFHYKLDGFDREWRSSEEADRYRHVTYGRLASGDYTFRLRAGNEDGVWNEKGDALAFFLRPFFYETAWFKISLLTVFLLGGTITAVARRKIRRPYKKSNLKPEQVALYQKQLQVYMDSEKPFLDPQLTLRRLADQISIPLHYLSQVINDKFGLNFNEFINGYRIAKARQILSDPKSKDYKLLTIAYEVGFNNKTTFNQVFKKVCGEPPSEYRRRFIAGNNEKKGKHL
jgi:ligand-binding sensor domain-containing protein/AraC-like DNA-binding protein